MANKDDLLRKIKALAEQGAPGEREAAKNMLEKLMLKYDIDSIDDIEDEQSEMREFHFRNKYDKRILLQIAYKVIGHLFKTCNYRIIATQKKAKNYIGISCTKPQEVEILFLRDFYYELYLKEVDFFLEAFIQKHNLFGTPNKDTDYSDDDFDMERVLKMRSLQNGMSEANPILRLEGNDNE